MSKRKATSKKRKAATRPGTGTKAELPPSTALERAANSPLPTIRKAKVALADEQFLALYMANGRNAAAAYLELHPGITPHSARTLGCRKLTQVDIRARLGELLDDAHKAAAMSGDEAVALLSGDGRSDMRLLVDGDGKRLGLHELPDALANSIDAIEFDDDGHIKKLKLVSKLSARRAILEVTGRVKGGETGIDELAAALRATLVQNAGATGGA